MAGARVHHDRSANLIVGSQPPTSLGSDDTNNDNSRQGGGRKCDLSTISTLFASPESQQLRSRARKAFGRGDYLEAREHFTQALLVDPNDPVLWNNRAMTYARLDYADLALADGRRALMILDKLPPEVEPQRALATARLRSKVAYHHAKSWLAARIPAQTLQYGALALRALPPEDHATESTPIRNLILKARRTVAKQADADAQRAEAGSVVKPRLIGGRYAWDAWDLRRDPNGLEKRLAAVIPLESRKDVEVLPAASLVPAPPVSSDSCQDGNSPKSSDEEGSSPCTAEEEAAQRPLHFGVFAARDIKVGETVFWDQPVVAADNRGDDGACGHCAVPLVCEGWDVGCPVECRCPKCGEAYCSKACRQDALSLYHFVLCGRKEVAEQFSWITEGVGGSAVYPAVVIKLLAATLQLELPNPLAFNGLGHLVPWTSMQTFFKGRYVFMLSSIERYFSLVEAFGLSGRDCVERFDYWVYDTLKRILMANAFGRVDRVFPDQSVAQSAWILPRISFINHSCAPNVLELPAPRGTGGLGRGGREVVTRQVVKKGEQLVASYCDDGTKEERQTQLLVSHGFICQCPKCKSDMSPDIHHLITLES